MEPNRSRGALRHLLFGFGLVVMLTGGAMWSSACAGSDGPVVTEGGPPPLPEEETAPKKDLAGSVWVPGYWDWDAKAGTWRWQNGDWVVPPRPDAVWVAPQHERRGNDWVLIPGYWK